MFYLVQMCAFILKLRNHSSFQKIETLLSFEIFLSYSEYMELTNFEFN
jgi:hypothetical protein